MATEIDQLKAELDNLRSQGTYKFLWDKISNLEFLLEGAVKEIEQLKIDRLQIYVAKSRLELERSQNETEKQFFKCEIERTERMIEEIKKG